MARPWKTGNPDADTAVWVRDLRWYLGLTQKQFAELVGVSFATVNRWEGGHAEPTALAWRRLEEIDPRYPRSKQ